MLRIRQSVLTVALALTLTACSQNPDPAIRVADTANDIMASTKVLVQTVVQAELTMTPQQKQQSGAVLDQFYLTAYQVGVRGEQAADLLDAYKAATDAASAGSLLERVEALLPVLERDIQKLAGIALPVGNTAEIVKLVANVQRLATTLKTEAARLRSSRTTARLVEPPNRQPASSGLAFPSYSRAA